MSGPDYAEFPTSAGVLAIFSAEAQEKYIPGSTETAQNKSVILEFRVANVDGEYRKAAKPGEDLGRNRRPRSHGGRGRLTPATRMATWLISTSRQKINLRNDL